MEQAYSSLTREVVSYLQKHYQEKVTLSQLTQHFHTNRTTLLRTIKHDMGITLNTYLVALRVKMAATLLRDTWLTITEICERTGFGEIGYFSKTFKKEMQMTPTQYRNKYRKG